jgi:hypothetical protein
MSVATRPRGQRQEPSFHTIQVHFTPNSDAQQKFIHTTAKRSAYIGGVGAGKTLALCLRAYLLAYTYPGNRGMLCRFTYPEIRDSLIPTFRQIIPRELMVNPDILDRKDIASQSLLVQSRDPDQPSEILFRNMEDQHKLKTELGFIGISQVDDPKITRVMWETLEGRLRWPVPAQFSFCEGNYGGNASVGGWVWDIFVDKHDGELFEGSPLDNLTNLPTDYQSRLAQMPEWWKQHHVYGSWSPLIEAKGKPCYPEFSFRTHVPEGGDVGCVRKMMTSGRPIVRGIDLPGSSACVWAQMDHLGRLLVGHELVTDMPVGIAEFADVIQSESAQYFPGAQFIDYIDPAAFRVEQTSGQSIAQILFAHGLKPRVGVMQVSVRQQAVRDWLTLMVKGAPGMLIDPGCHRLIGGFQGGYFVGQAGIPVKQGDYSHVHDALQYACSGIVRLQYGSELSATQRNRQARSASGRMRYWIGRMNR